jgi:hypothetical protein
MTHLDRRTFLGASAGALALLHDAVTAAAQTSCVTGGLPAFLPNRLTVDCGSKRNFQLFRANSNYLGLAAVVSMTFVRGKWGTYQAGNLFLFPWLKPKGRALGAGKAWGAVLPVNAVQTMPARPVPNRHLPVDEYVCRFLLEAPHGSFIGFTVDLPYHRVLARLPHHTNVDKLADGQGVGIDWTSSNLNGPWFGGSRTIPDGAQCDGNKWRKLIIAGLMTASAPAC